MKTYTEYLTGEVNFTCIGDSLSCTIGGVTYTAYLEHDPFTKPEDADCYDESDIKRFYNDEWLYCGLVIKAERKGWHKNYLASLWGLELNLSDNSYLLEAANELLLEAIEEASK